MTALPLRPGCDQTRVLYQDERTALIHGDAREMAEVPAAAVDLIITDPPFNLGVRYGTASKDRRPPSLYGAWTGEWLRECLRVLKPGGQLYALMPLKWVPWWLPYVPQPFRILAWCKTMAHLHREKTYIRAWEPVLWLVKGGGLPATFHPRDGEELDWFTGSNALGESRRIPQKRRHPTPRPDWLYERFILASSDPDMVVCDPMMGSGTGAYVARKLGRRFIGYDIEEKYVHLASERVFGINESKGG